MNINDMNDMKEVLAAQETGAAAAVEYRVVANAMPATQEDAPFLGRTSAAGSCSQDELAERMVKAGCQMPVAEIRRVWNGTGAYLAETMPEAPRAFDVGFMRVWPVLGGTFPSADADFDSERNTLYVAAAPSVAVREALAGGTPSKTGGSAAGDPSIGNVTWNGVDADTIKVGEPFQIVGTSLTATAGDEYAELKLPKGMGGGTVPVELSAQVSAADGMQRLTGRLARPVAACEGAVLVVHTHGATASPRLFHVPSGRLTVLAGETPTGPTVTAINDGTFYPSGGNIVTGEHMRFASDDPGSHVTVTDAEGRDVGATVTTDAEVPVTDSRFGLVVEGDLTDGEEYIFAFDMLDAAGNPVTVTKAARFSAS